MRFSTRAKYGLRICFLLGISREDTMPLSLLVKQSNLSEKYLEQILSKLKKGGIVNSARGASGGYTLSRGAKDITINEILKALDDGFDLTDCATIGCSDEYCPNKKIFKKLHSGINSLLDNFTLEDMISEHRCK